MGSRRTCVFVFVPEQGAALLEDFGAEVTWVDAVLQPPLLHGGRVGVVLLLGGRDAVGAAVGLLLLLLLMEDKRTVTSEHVCD